MSLIWIGNCAPTSKILFLFELFAQEYMKIQWRITLGKRSSRVFKCASVERQNIQKRNFQTRHPPLWKKLILATLRLENVIIRTVLFSVGGSGKIKISILWDKELNLFYVIFFVIIGALLVEIRSDESHGHLLYYCEMTNPRKSVLQKNVERKVRREYVETVPWFIFDH